jgi:hypothetical protein
MIYQRLACIQQKLEAPKGQFNSFGKYNYRSCEDILKAVKPHLGTDLSLIITDEIVLIGERYYVHATATLTDGKESVSSSAYAREEDSKRGMDASQLTGATSSYARKYALNGLLLIDDTKDADTQDNRDKSKSEQKPEPPKSAPKPEPPKTDIPKTILDNKPLKAKIEAMISEAGISRDFFKQWLFTLNKIGTINDAPSLNTMTVESAKAMIDKWAATVAAYNKWVKTQQGVKE